MATLTRIRNGILVFGFLGMFLGFVVLRIGWWASENISRDDPWMWMAFSAIGGAIGFAFGLLFGLFPSSSKYIKTGDEEGSQSDS